MNKLEKVIFSIAAVFSAYTFSPAQSKNDFSSSEETYLLRMYSNSDKKNSNTNVDMNVVRKYFNLASDITYVHDSVSHPSSSKFYTDKTGNTKVYDYWQSPKETKKTGKGDSEDMAIYLYELLKNQKIKSKLCVGEMEIGDKNTHMWVESSINDTLYIIDPSIRGIYFRTTKDVNGTINPRRYYILDESIYYLKGTIDEYSKRTKHKLEFWNKIEESKPLTFDKNNPFYMYGYFIPKVGKTPPKQLFSKSELDLCPTINDYSFSNKNKRDIYKSSKSFNKNLMLKKQNNRNKISRHKY